MVNAAIEAAMKGPMYSLREDGGQNNSHRFHLRLFTLQGSKFG